MIEQAPWDIKIRSLANGYIVEDRSGVQRAFQAPNCIDYTTDGDIIAFRNMIEYLIQLFGFNKAEIVDKVSGVAVDSNE